MKEGRVVLDKVKGKQVKGIVTVEYLNKIMER